MSPGFGMEGVVDASAFADSGRSDGAPMPDVKVTNVTPSAVLQRLDALMKRCREDAHEPTYADLLAVKGGA